MLASNVTGREPTLFNGGLFTFDPLYVNGKKGPGYTPDHRQWGAAFTAQNQRLVYRPMLKAGDFDLLPAGFSFYLNGLPNATARVRHYWKHDGCCFEEQSAITALPGACQYGFFEGGRRGRPQDFEVGIQEMLMQTHGGKIRLLPAWPGDWDVDFKLHAPKRTIVRCNVQSGKSALLQVTPPERQKDVVVNSGSQ